MTGGYKPASVDIRRVNDRITVEEIPYRNVYSPRYIVTFFVVAEHETPFLNGLRRLLGLDSAEPHTTIVHEQSYVGSLRDNATEPDEMAGLSPTAQEIVEERGYEIVSLDEAVDRYDATEFPWMLERRVDA